MPLAKIAPLKAPFTYFGGKSRVASEVWKRFGNVRNYVEPFFGSGAVLLGRPQPFEGLEKVNDADGMLCNFWRALQADAETVAKYADWPVNENDLHARHAWLVERRDSLQSRLEGDPDFYDIKSAGWWVWGLSIWLGHGWCGGSGPWTVEEISGERHLVKGEPNGGICRKLPALSSGVGVHRQRSKMGYKHGVTRQMPSISHGNGANGKTGIGEWFAALSDRLRDVRVCCGDWSRVCGGKSGDALSHMVENSPCGVFLDPPYALAGRDNRVYTFEDDNLHRKAREWAIAHGDDPRLRIALCGYEGEHEMPEGWSLHAWAAHGGFGMLYGHGRGRENAKRERIWFSPHCLHGSDDAAPAIQSANGSLFQSELEE